MAQTPPTPPPPSGGKESPNRTIMIVLAYLWILGLIPLLVEKEDQEVQWHAKNGLLLLAAEFIIWIAINILGFLPGVGVVLGCGLTPLVFLLFLIVRVVAIAKGVQGGRLVLPVISDYVEKWR